MQRLQKPKEAYAIEPIADDIPEAFLPPVPRVEVLVRYMTYDGYSHAQPISNWSTNLLAKLAHNHMTATVEQFVVIAFDADGIAVGISKVSIGTPNETAIVYHEIIRTVLNLGNIDGVLIAHNHPGDLMQPSDADIRVTNNMVTILSACGIKVIDHLILGHGRYLSFRRNDLFVNTFNLPKYITEQI